MTTRIIFYEHLARSFSFFSLFSLSLLVSPNLAMAYYTDAENLDAALSHQTIITNCGCRCLLVTGYYAATFSTKTFLASLHCADIAVVVHGIATTLKNLKYEANRRSLAFVTTAASVSASFVFTMGASEIVPSGINSGTTAYLGVRLAHLANMIANLKMFKKTVKVKP